MDEKRENELKQEFARAFGWFDSNRYEGNFKLKTPTWEEIFVEIGKLLAGQKALTYITDIEGLKINMEELLFGFRQLKNKN